MSRQLFKPFTVNGNQYQVRAMTADAAYRFGLKVGALVAPILPAIGAAAGQGGASVILAALQSLTIDPDKLAAISEEARSQIILPDNRQANSVTWNAWFDDHPDEMYQANLLAIWNLVSDFLPPSLRTAATSIASTAAKASPSTSPTAGSPTPSSAGSASPA